MAACMPRMSRLEEGSGTMAGVMLVMLVGVALRQRRALAI